MARRDMTPTELATLRALAERGASGGEIARVLRRAPSGVLAHMKRLGMPRAEHATITVELKSTTMAALSAAAGRRRLEPQALAQMIIDGTLRRGSIDRTINAPENPVMREVSAQGL